MHAQYVYNMCIAWFLHAERRLLAFWVDLARKHGVKQHQTVSWVRRKAGSQLCIWRYTCDGALGCSVPCVLCKPQLQKFGLRVTCVLASGAVFSGHLHEDSAPVSKPTLSQRINLFKKKC